MDRWGWSEIGSGIWVPYEITAEGLPVPELDDIVVDLRARLNFDGNEYNVHDLRARVTRGSTYITGTILRQIPVRWLLRSAVLDQARLRTGPDGREFSVLLPPMEAQRLAEAGPKPETLDAVARVYLIATVTVDSPAKRVAEEFEIPQRTATHWIKLARERGHLKGK